MDDIASTAMAVELRLLRAEVAELRTDQQALLRRLLDRDDRRIGASVFPLADELMGAVAFTVPDLARRAMNTRDPLGRAVLELLEEAGAGTPATEVNLRAAGRLFARLEGAALSGLRLVAAGETREGLRWRLVRVSGGE